MTITPTPNRTKKVSRISRSPLRSRIWAPSATAQQNTKDDWTTPRAVFDALHAEFNFDLDAAASPTNALCDRYYTSADDSLLQPWSRPVWLNPPYGRQLSRWLRKAHDESLLGETVVCLIPASTSTAWWHDHVMKAAEIRLVRGRLKFGGASSGAPFASAVVIFRPPYLCGAQPVFKVVEL